MTDQGISLSEAALRLAANKITSVALVESCLERASATDGEGARVFTVLHARQARRQAVIADRMRQAGMVPSPFLGVPISIKDLFDEAGRVTLAGSIVASAMQKAARADATVIARLKAAGFIVIGRTNMTEFAYSGLGLNPHYGTPLNPYDRRKGRIPGGSSSGAAVSVSDGMAFGAIGSDTGGSCRIPAALCGLVGYKPTARVVPMDGVFPLSQSLDSIGSLAHDVQSVSALHAIMAGSPVNECPAKRLNGIRVGVPSQIVMDNADEKVARDFERALEFLSAEGAHIFKMPMKSWKRIPDMGKKGGLVAAEAYALHRRFLNRNGTDYDPRVLTRILRGGEQGAADYLDTLKMRQVLIREFNDEVSLADVLVFPTTPVTAPEVGRLKDDTEYFNEMNLLMLRNSTTINLSDGCAVSVPMHEFGTAPTGLTVAAAGGKDEHLLSLAQAMEVAISTRTRGGNQSPSADLFADTVSPGQE